MIPNFLKEVSQVLLYAEFELVIDMKMLSFRFRSVKAQRDKFPVIR